ncbi:MAG TPA: histidinol-phosphate transaminase, partial [Chryseobacterium sp.]|nr:histidinol-phosphate transaminase [Chryseobacterium sp.]
SLNKISELIINKGFIKSNIENTLDEISWLRNELETINCIKKVFPSDANFFLIQFENVDKVYRKLLENEILTSKRSPQIPDCIRINVGKREENNRLINVLKSI